MRNILSWLIVIVKHDNYILQTCNRNMICDATYTCTTSRNNWVELVYDILTILSRFQSASLESFEDFFEKAIKNEIHVRCENYSHFSTDDVRLN